MSADGATTVSSRVTAGAAQPLWVFGYGSLMWQPGFRFAEARHARISGYRRAFCVYSIHYRGTLKRPGLVLGLQRGGTCEGIAFRIAAEDAAAVRAYLHARELIYGVYREAVLPADILEGGPQRVDVLTYVAEPCHPSFAGPVPPARQVAIIRGARGVAGSNLAYFAATLLKLKALGIRQRDLERLAGQLGVGGLIEAGSAEPFLEARCRAFVARPAASNPLRNGRRHAFCFRRALAF